MQKDILLLYANILSSYIILAKLALPSNRSPMHLNAWKKLQQLKQKNPRIQNREHSAGKNAFLWQKLKAQNIKEASAARTKKFCHCCYITEILPDWSSSSRMAKVRRGQLNKLPIDRETKSLLFRIFEKFTRMLEFWDREECSVRTDRSF